LKSKIFFFILSFPEKIVNIFDYLSVGVIGQLFIIHYSLFIIHHSLFIIHYSFDQFRFLMNNE